MCCSWVTRCKIISHKVAGSCRTRHSHGHRRKKSSNPRFGMGYFRDSEQRKTSAEDLQNDKLLGSQRQYWEQGETNDEACEGGEIAGPKDQHAVPSTH